MILMTRLDLKANGHLSCAELLTVGLYCTYWHKNSEIVEKHMAKIMIPVMGAAILTNYWLKAPIRALWRHKLSTSSIPAQ